MRKIISGIFMFLALCAFTGAAKESGNFYVDSFVEAVSHNSSTPAEYDGHDIVMTVHDNSAETESSVRAIGAEAMGEILKEQLMKELGTADSATKQLLDEISKAGCGIRLLFVSGTQSATARITPEELHSLTF